MNRTLRKFAFTTSVFWISSMASAQCCDYLLVMHDSYGDDWNGGLLQVNRNGSLIGIFSAIGAGNDTVFTVCNGDQLELVYSAGDYENENTYQLFDPAGNVVFADGPTPNTGIVFTGVGDCDAVAAPGSVPCAAIPIDTVDCLLVDNTTAIGTGIDPGCANYQGSDLWYVMPVPPSGNVSVGTYDAGGLNDTGVALWTGTNCIDLTQRGCDDDGGDVYFSLALAYELPVGEMLYIQVFGYGGGTGAFELCVTDLGTVTLESSELPIVMINTLGQEIVDEPKIDALMEIKYNGPGNLTYVTDPANVYNGVVGIEIRGASSAGYPQRPYGFETRDSLGANLDVSLLGMPAEHDWVLLSNYNDRSLIKNQLAFKVSEGMGQYAPRTHLCEVLVDSVYKGIYVFGEKIKRDAGRVDIAKLTADENSGDDLTGGYIFMQAYWDNNNSFLSNYHPIDHPEFDVYFVYHTPSPDSITDPQRDYIAAFVDSVETALYSTAFADPAIGYRKYMDVKSFIDYFLVNEVSRSNDGFKKSVYFHKDKNSNGGKLKAGPVWDFDWAWKNIASCSIFSATDGSGWAHQINDCFTDNYSCGWYLRLLQDSSFNDELRCSYEEYRTTVLDTAFLFNYIDSIGDRVQNAQARHFQKWPLLGVGGEAPDVGPVATTYAAELDSLKAWITLRLAWLDANIPGTCINTSVEASNAVSTLSCYPNPSSGVFHFQGSIASNGSHVMSIHDLAWRELDRFPLSSGQQNFDYMINGSGTYFFSVQDRSGRTLQLGKLIVF
ncbi:MAG: CotH kinase family protein [Flavobacteriales bacterium]|nr:CotH kinase family protein [Flavobacteriales bacterium]